MPETDLVADSLKLLSSAEDRQNSQGKRGKKAELQVRPSLALLAPGESGMVSWALRNLGGLRGVITYVRALAKEDRAFALLARAWDTAPADVRKKLSVEDFLASVGMAPSMFIGRLAAKAFEMNADIGSLMVSVAHPEIVKTSVEQALTPEGVEDRKMLFRHMGINPGGGGGSTVNVNVNAQGGSAAVTAASSPIKRFEDRANLNSGILREDVIDIIGEAVVQDPDALDSPAAPAALSAENGGPQ